MPNLPPLKSFVFDLMLFGDAIGIQCEIDERGQIHNISFTHPDMPDSFMRSFLKVRRYDKDNQPRLHDARLVSSKADHSNGTVQFTVEFAEIYVPFEEIAYAAADECYQQNLHKINAHAPEVIKNALKAIYAAG